jgi:hypothetical protein
MFLAVGVWALTRPRPDADLLGVDPQGTPAYHIESSQAKRPNYYSGVYTGQKYECVEFARRWLVRNRGITFRSVERAVDLLTLEQAATLSGQPVKVTRVSSPEVGDLAIFPVTDANPYGHVAVEVRVVGDRVQLAEQNQSSRRWIRDYSRELPLSEIPHLLRMN